MLVAELIDLLRAMPETARVVVYVARLGIEVTDGADGRPRPSLGRGLGPAVIDTVVYDGGEVGIHGEEEEDDAFAPARQRQACADSNPLRRDAVVRSFGPKSIN